MASYLVEIRLGGAIKRKLRTIIQDIADQFNERALVRSHYVPHISLYGPCRTTNQKAVLKQIRNECAQYDLVPFLIEGFDHFDQSTIYADVHSSYELRKLRYSLSKRLKPLTTDEKPYDHDRWCKFHCTVARNIDSSFDDVWNYVTANYDIRYEGYVERVNLIRNGNIVKEYSVPQGRFLNSDAATAKPGWERDETIIQRYFSPGDHENLVSSQPGLLKKWKTLFADRSKTIERRRKSEFVDRPPQTFISGDLHLNHGNMIEYCDRPFETVHEMNQELVANWNDTVGPDDTVIFVGDLAFYYGDITTYDWLHALNGDIIYIRGNHDEAKGIDYEENHILESESRRYFCTHRPDDVPEDWDGWAIHGHVHNNDLEQHPFINAETQRINAAPELMEYTPIPLADIEAEIGESAGTIETSDELSQSSEVIRPDEPV